MTLISKLGHHTPEDPDEPLDLSELEEHLRDTLDTGRSEVPTTALHRRLQDIIETSAAGSEGVAQAVSQHSAGLASKLDGIRAVVGEATALKGRVEHLETRLNELVLKTNAAGWLGAPAPQAPSATPTAPAPAPAGPAATPPTSTSPAPSTPAPSIPQPPPTSVPPSSQGGAHAASLTKNQLTCLRAINQVEDQLNPGVQRDFATLNGELSRRHEDSLGRMAREALVLIQAEHDWDELCRAVADPSELYERIRSCESLRGKILTDPHGLEPHKPAGSA